MKGFRTRRGALEGDEADGETYFAHSARLRIFAETLDFAAIEAAIGCKPTWAHRRGEYRSASSREPHRQDHWSIASGLPEDRPLEEHIDTLWAKVRHAKGFLLDLKRTATVDVFLGYRSNVDHAGIEVPAASLEMFVELDIPFGVSIIIT